MRRLNKYVSIDFAPLRIFSMNPSSNTSKYTITAAAIDETAKAQSRSRDRPWGLGTGRNYSLVLVRENKTSPETAFAVLVSAPLSTGL